MGRLWKVSHKDVPVVSSFSSAYSLDEPFVPNDFAEDDSYPMSPVVIYVFPFLFILLLVFTFSLFNFLWLSFLFRNSEDDGNFDRALFEFYMNHVRAILFTCSSCFHMFALTVLFFFVWFLFF